MASTPEVLEGMSLAFWVEVLRAGPLFGEVAGEEDASWTER